MALDSATCLVREDLGMFCVAPKRIIKPRWSGQCLPRIHFPFLQYQHLSLSFSFFRFFLLFRAAPGAYGSSQARGQIGAAVAGPHHSHSDVGSKLSLRPNHSSGQQWILNPLSEARD